MGVWIETSPEVHYLNPLSHTLRGCVDWNSFEQAERFRLKVTPCVGVWIETLSLLSWKPCSQGHTLRGCVDWNILYTCFNDKHNTSHTLRGCVDWNININYIRPTANIVTPCVGVWIETVLHLESVWLAPSHPAWVCGLKRIHSHKHSCIYSHTLRGCVDWNSNTWCAITHHQSHTLRGCVDWNRCISCGLIYPISHTLRGCVDWNWQPYWSGCQSMVTPCVGVWIETWMGIA